MASKAETVAEYLKEVPAERLEDIEAVRMLILDHLPPGYVEVMRWGMITYEVPLEVYPDTYNKKPLMYASLANQKNYMTVSSMGLYCRPGLEKEFTERFAKAGKKLDMGKICMHFKTLDDLDLETVAWAVVAVPINDHVQSFKDRSKKK